MQRAKFSVFGGCLKINTKIGCAAHFYAGLVSEAQNGPIKKSRLVSHPTNLDFIPPRPGFEPGTYRLTAECSTAELSRIAFISFDDRRVLNIDIFLSVVSLKN